jgi:hypothetical protein
LRKPDSFATLAQSRSLADLFIEHTEVGTMTMHDPLWTAAARVRERAEAYAAERTLMRELQRPSAWSRIEVGIGSLLIALGDRTRALGCRLADACGCADSAVQHGSVSSSR